MTSAPSVADNIAPADGPAAAVGTGLAAVVSPRRVCVALFMALLIALALSDVPLSLTPPRQTLVSSPLRPTLVVEDYDHHLTTTAPALMTQAVTMQKGHDAVNTTSLPPALQPTHRPSKEARVVQLRYVNSSVPLSDLLGMTPINAAALCELFLLGHPKCRIVHGEENMEGCVLRYGVDVWSTALQPQCTRSVFWKSLASSLRVVEAGGERRSMPSNGEGIRGTMSLVRSLYDPVMQAHVGRHSMRPLRFARNVSSGARNTLLHNTTTTVAAVQPTPFPDPLVCSYGLVHMIGFCVPDNELDWLTPAAAEVPPELPFKVWDWYPVLPSYVPYHETKRIQKKLGARPRFVSGAEDEYAHTLAYRYSRFAWTHARMGADCQRHYDIIAGGAVPVFPDLKALPARTAVPHLPRALLVEGVFQLPGIRGVVPDVGVKDGKINTEYYYRTWAKQMNFKKAGVVDHSAFDPAAYASLQSELLTYTQKYLTCGSIAQYALQVVLKRNHSEPEASFTSVSSSPPRVLFIGHPTIDYMTVAVERGLYELGLEYSVLLPLGEHHQDEPIGASGEDVYTGEAYDAWRQRRALTDIYGRNYHVGKRLPPPPPHRRVAPSAALCDTLNGTYDVVLFSHPLKHSILCEDALQALVSAGQLRVGIVDGGDAASTALYPALAMRGFHIFSREASC